MYAVSNNYNVICEGCLEDIVLEQLHQPAFKTAIKTSEPCELCGGNDAE